MNRLIIVRHGESEANRRQLISGWTDTPLTERGRRQASATAKSVFTIANGCSCRLYSSDLLRAADTASNIGAELGIEPILSPELRDLNTGVAANKPASEQQKLRLPVEGPLLDWIPYPGGESWRMMDRRISSFLDLINDFGVNTIIIVSHGNPIVCMVHWWLGLHDDASKTRIMVEADLCSITVLTIDSWGSRTISQLNNTAHLGQIE